MTVLAGGLSGLKLGETARRTSRCEEARGEEQIDLSPIGLPANGDSDSHQPSQVLPAVDAPAHDGSPAVIVPDRSSPVPVVTIQPSAGIVLPTLAIATTVVQPVAPGRPTCTKYVGRKPECFSDGGSTKMEDWLVLMDAYFAAVRLPDLDCITTLVSFLDARTLVKVSTSRISHTCSS